MAEPFARDEERTADVEAEGVVLERRVSTPHRVAVATHVERVIRDLDAMDEAVVPLDAHVRVCLLASSAEGRPCIPRGAHADAPHRLVAAVPVPRRVAMRPDTRAAAQLQRELLNRVS